MKSITTPRIVLLGLFIFALPAHASLSTNLITAGSFQGQGFNGVNTTGEDLSFIKTLDSPRTQPEIDASLNPVRAWQFHPGGVAAETAGGVNAGQSFTDLGKWIGCWGIGAAPDPRNPMTIPSPTHNRSIVTRDGSPTGVMEGVAFRNGVAQFVQAPATMVAGPAKLDLDYFFRYWAGGADSSTNILILHDTPQVLNLQVWGIMADQLPTYLDRFHPFDDNVDLAVDYGWTPLFSGPNFNSQQHSKYLRNVELDAPFVPGAPIGAPDDQVWKRLSDGVVQLSGSAANPGPTTYVDGSFTISRKYDYFYVSAYMTTYAEQDPYFWLYGVKPTDSMSVAIDNVSLRVSLAPVIGPYGPGDFNLDGLVNVQDITPFILALHGPTTYVPYLLNRMAILGIDSKYLNLIITQINNNPNVVFPEPVPDYPPLIEPWPFTVQCINPFVAKLAANGVDAADLAVIPEPASLTLLALGATILVRRRR